MKDIDQAFLQESVQFIDNQTLLPGLLQISTHSGEMDRVIIQFRADGVCAQLAKSYTTEERWHFFAIMRWRPVAAYLVKLWSAFPSITGIVDLWLDDVSNRPGLVFTLTGVPGQLAIPDPIFLESNSYTKLRSEAAETPSEWLNRESIIFWRGASTGYRSAQQPGWRDLPRLQLCAVASSNDDSLPYDVGITHIVQIADPEEIAEINNSGWMKEPVSQFQFGRYRYSIDIDGNSNSWPGLFCKFLLGITVLKVESLNDYRQWYYEDMKPWFHFIPVAADLSDLIVKSQWALNHEHESAAIAKNAQQFAEALTVEATLAPTAHRLIRYLHLPGYPVSSCA